MRAAEGHAFSHQVISAVGCVGEAVQRAVMHYIGVKGQRTQHGFVIVRHPI